MKLGKRQLEMLIKICKTNGGGLYVSGRDEKIIMRLHELELVQGKSGAQYCAVHTTKGMKLYKSLVAL